MSLVDSVNKSPITPRQWEVLRLLADGKSQKEVATALELSTRTVSNHVTDIYDRLKVTKLAEAIKWLHRNEDTFDIEVPREA